MKFGFAGASMTLSKSEHVTSGNTRRVKVTVKGLQENLTVSYRWYVDGKAVSKPRGTRTLKKGTNTFTYSYKAKAKSRRKWNDLRRCIITSARCISKAESKVTKGHNDEKSASADNSPPATT